MVKQRRIFALVATGYLAFGCSAQQTEASQPTSMEIADRPPPMELPCVPTPERLCPFRYSQEEKAEREDKRREIANLPRSEADLCDLRAFNEIEFSDFEKVLWPATNDFDFVWMSGSRSPPFPEIIATGKYARISIADHSFIFAKDIAVRPENPPTKGDDYPYYFGYFEDPSEFERMGWPGSGYLSFGHIYPNDNMTIRSPWIEKMIRAYEHLHTGFFDKEEQYQRFLEHGKVEPRPKYNYGYSHDPWMIHRGKTIAVTTSYRSTDISLDSNLFVEHGQYQEIVGSKLFVSENKIKIITGKPRLIVAEITRSRPVAEFKVCTRLKGRK